MSHDAAWIDIKKAYLKDKRRNLLDIYKSIGAEIKEKHGWLPTFPTVKRTCSRQKWAGMRRGVFADAEKTARQRMMEYAAKIGFRAECDVLDTARDMLSANKVEIVRDNNAQGGDAKGFAEVKPDYMARDKAIGHLAKMFELYGADKVMHSGDAVTEIVVNFQTERKSETPSDEVSA